MNIDQVVQRFKFLDLTEYQARVLYALLKHKSCSISEISKVSSVPNTRVYDIVKQLISMDYVIQISDRPKLYRVRNVDMVLDSLISKKSVEFNRVKKEIDELRIFFKDDEQDEKNKIVKVDRELDLIKILNEELINAKKSVIGFGSSELTHSSIKGTLSKIANNNIDIKLLTHSEYAPELEASGLNFIKAFDHNLSAYLIDGKKLILRLSKAGDDVHHMSVSNNHEDLKNMVGAYFEFCWANK